MAKIMLSVITAFLFIVSIYLIVTGKRIEGSFLAHRGGWVHNSFNGYVLLLVAIGFLLALRMVFKGKKIRL